MKVALFIPCYIDQFYPEVGMATVGAAGALRLEVDYPLDQTCCGQPMANTGCHDEVPPAPRSGSSGNFAGYDYVVARRAAAWRWCGSITMQYLRRARSRKLAAKTFELCEFLVDVLKVREHFHGLISRTAWACIKAATACANCGQRDEIVEIAGPAYSKRSTCSRLDGIEFVMPPRPDECCGFGGTFACLEEAVSCMMGTTASPTTSRPAPKSSRPTTCRA